MGGDWVPALEKANAIRIRRADLKAGIWSYEISLADVIDPLIDTEWDDAAYGMKVDELLRAAVRVGRGRASKIMGKLAIEGHNMRHDVRVCELGDPRRAQLATLLRERKIGVPRA